MLRLRLDTDAAIIDAIEKQRRDGTQTTDAIKNLIKIED